MKSMKLTLLGCCILSVFAACDRSAQKEGSTKAEMKVSENQFVKINLSDEPATIDPRKARSLESINLIRLMFEGLLQIDEKGTIQPAIAESYEISNDQKTITFHLRDCKWSNGDPVTASDFEYSWKTSLNPAFGAPNAYQLFIIKNGKSAYEGLTSIDEVGVQAVDPKTLVVTLQNPTPYFLQMAAFHPFFPINQKWDQEHSNWSINSAPACLSNGPFQIDSWKPSAEIQLSKNKSYWNKEIVQLDKVCFNILDDNLAFSLFEKGDIDWTGSPTSTLPPDAIQTLKNQGKLQIADAAGTQFLRVNVEKAPLDNTKFRQAFNLALNRKAIVEHILQGNQKEALSFLPPSLGLQKSSFFKDNDLEMAQKLFEEALIETGISKDQFPPIQLSYTNSERSHKIAQAIQQNWQEAFHIPVNLETCESKLFYDKLLNKNYQLAMGSWFADFADPISFLSVFQYKDNGTNNTQWAHPEYTRCLEESAFESEPEKRLAELNKAQQILMQELPIFPIFHFAFNYIKSDQLQGSYLSPLGYIELRKAWRVENKSKPQSIAQSSKDKSTSSPPQSERSQDPELHTVAVADSSNPQGFNSSDQGTTQPEGASDESTFQDSRTGK